MKKINALFLAAFCSCLLLFVACKGDSSNNADTNTAETASPSKTETPVAPKKDSNTIRAAFESAAVYAAATDYAFLSEDRIRHIVRVSDLEEEQQPEVPSYLLETGEVEGPRGANPDMIGRFFLLKKDEQGKIMKVIESVE